MPVLNHIHDWVHLGGDGFGMYRCQICFCFGYSKRYRGMQKHGNTVVPYRCEKCSARAVAKDDVTKQSWRAVRRYAWRCANHRVKPS